MANATVAKGCTVEVSSNEPGFNGAWYVATLIDELNPPPTNQNPYTTNTNETRYLVKYDTLLTDDGSHEPLTEVVEPSCVRPLPPRNLRRNNVKSAIGVVVDGGGADFEMYDVVDAYHKEGWWIGVVNKVVNGGGGVRKYVVSFENPPEDVEFGRAQMRLHVDWVDGRWLVRPKKIPEHVLAARNAKRALESNNVADSGFATPSKEAQTTDVDNLTVGPQLSYMKKSVSKKNTEGNSEMAGAVEASDSSRRNERIMNSEEQDSRRKRFQSSAGSKENTKVKVSVMEKCGSDAIHRDSPLMEHERVTPGTCEAKDGKSHEKKKRGRPPKLLAKRPISSLQGGHEITVDLDELPLSQLPGVNRSSCCRPDHRDEPPNLAIVTSVGTDYEQTWPFIKRSPIWATIASLEVYQSPPQRPHFSPLKKIKEDHREGLAIAHMVTFGNLVQMLPDIQLTGPIDVINNSLEILGDLEAHGFNVGAIRSRLNKLLSLKSKASQHEIELKKAEAELEKCNGEKRIEEKEMKEMQLKMQELQEKMVRSATMMKVKEEEAMRLQSNLNHYSEQITDCELAFKKLAATPLQVTK